MDEIVRHKALRGHEPVSHGASVSEFCETCQLSSKLETATLRGNAAENREAVLEAKLSTAHAEIERLKAENTDQFRSANAECKRLELQVRALRIVLAKIEWVYNSHLEASYCPMCGNDDESGHTEDCEIPKALAGERPIGLETRINDTSPKQREITPEEFAKGIGAEPMSPKEAAEWKRKHLGGVEKPKCECIPGVHKNCPEHGYPPIRPLEGPGSVDE